MLLGTRAFHRSLNKFRRDQGRGDIAACLIEPSTDFQTAVAIFNDWRHDPKPRAMEAAVDAMVARLRAEGETLETEEFLLAEMAAMVGNVAQSFPNDPAGVNDGRRFERMIMCFEGMWKEPDLFPKK